MSFTWINLENLSVEQICSIFIKENPAAKNLLIAHLAGQKPIECLPEDVIQYIIKFLDYKSKLRWGQTCHQFYSCTISTTKEYCRIHKTLDPLDNRDYAFIKEMVEAWSEDELTQIIKNYLPMMNCESNLPFLLSSIYQIIRDRTNKIPPFPNKIWIKWDQKSFIDALIKFPIFAEFIYFISKPANIFIEMINLIKVFPIKSLSPDELKITRENVYNLIHNYSIMTNAEQYMCAWYSCKIYNEYCAQLTEFEQSLIQE